jgi:hypothetical protein
MKKLLCMVALLPCLAQAEILTIFADKGFPEGSGVWAGGAGSNEGEDTSLVPPEGIRSWRAQTTAAAWWGYTYPTAQNFSRFNSGEMRFWVYATRGDIRVEIHNTSGRIVNRRLDNLGWTNSDSGAWKLLRIPLNGLDLSALSVPVAFVVDSGETIYYVDQVRYVDSTALPIFEARLCPAGDTACASEAAQVTWTGAAGAWKTADQYIKLTVDADTVAWGVQIYTNNTLPAANPRYTISGSSNPAGLVHTVITSQKIALAWSVKAATLPVTDVTPVAAEPNNAGDSNSFQWIYIKDAATPTIPDENTTAFSPGEIPVTVRSQKGIHYGQNELDFGAENPPHYVFLEANFGQALAVSTYRTSTLVVEFFSL